MNPGDAPNRDRCAEIEDELRRNVGAESAPAGEGELLYATDSRSGVRVICYIPEDSLREVVRVNYYDRDGEFQIAEFTNFIEADSVAAFVQSIAVL